LLLLVSFALVVVVVVIGLLFLCQHWA
jgi:hypothetical protein